LHVPLNLYLQLTLYQTDPVDILQDYLLWRSIILRQLNLQVGSLPDEIQAQVQALNQLEALSEALLDFNSLNDLSNWLGASTLTNLMK
jgi:Domain of unknown function (DUF4351)